jgi:hypothetical protein
MPRNGDEKKNQNNRCNETYFSHRLSLFTDVLTRPFISQSIIVWTFDSILQITNEEVSFRGKPESSLFKGLWMPDQVRHDELRTL